MTLTHDPSPCSPSPSTYASPGSLGLAACLSASYSGAVLRYSRSLLTQLPEKTQKTLRWCSVNSGGGSRPNCWNSLRRKAATPVRLRWVRRGQAFRRRMMLYVVC